MTIVVWQVQASTSRAGQHQNLGQGVDKIRGLQFEQCVAPDIAERTSARGDAGIVGYKDVIPRVSDHERSFPARANVTYQGQEI